MGNASSNREVWSGVTLFPGNNDGGGVEGGTGEAQKHLGS